jgi:hypothetical protein
MTQPRFRVSLTYAPLVLALTCIPSLTGAQGLSDGVGEIGLTFGHNRVDDTDGDRANVGFSEFAGSYSFKAGPRLLLGFDASFRLDDLASDPDFADTEDPESQYALGAHALWDLGADTRLGGFAAYGDTQSQGDPQAGDYDYWLLGVEARHFFGADLMGYAQVGFGDKGRTGDDAGEGFNDGRVVRLGATYFVQDHSAFTLDLELASADPYIDGSDKGEFFAATLGGETRLATEAPLMATYYVRYDRIDGTTETDLVEELQIGLGIKYVFGAASPREAARAGRSIGTPYLPGRASAWTEFLD